jgi:hypothetical protein
MHDQIFAAGGFSNRQSINQSINQYIPSELCDINICPNFPLRDTAPLKYITPLQTNFGM